ncbi:MAG: aminomethyl-transferring glycine dehydrogenase subunit GcvPB, partial [Pirellulaceae bacterium]|nr:aminomethyl-transferring glycine dehydrogenase subunit GcvPB [Pirellulaceae bacterium]
MRNPQTSQLIFELSKPGRRSARYTASDIPTKNVDELLPKQYQNDQPLDLPEVSEPEVVRHFTNLSTLNMSVDTHFYPLGSCTMKYNPKRNERFAASGGLGHLHPYQPSETLQGMFQLLYEMQQILAEISGLPKVSLQPAAGAHGELTALMVAAAHFRSKGQNRTKVLSPDSSHGTNPASAKMAGFQAITVKSDDHGYVDLDDLKAKLDDETAVFMITNPSTLGIFDKKIQNICDLVHEAGALIYLDGANMNAILGTTRPGDFGADMMHFNPHKTFSGPHGGGGPGAGPICVTEELGVYLPTPTISFDGETYHLEKENPKS